MRRTMTEINNTVRKLAHPRPVRLYADNDIELRELATRLNQDYSVLIVQLIRDCVDAGIPIVRRRFKL